jgi:hypothetical protein
MAYGTVTASFTIGGFSLEGLSAATRDGIDERLDTLRQTTSF